MSSTQKAKTRHTQPSRRKTLKPPKNMTTEEATTYAYRFKPASLHAQQNLLDDLNKLDLLWNPPPNPYTMDPTLWAHEVAKIETWSKQDEIYQSVAQHRYTAVKSCHGPGKSFTAAHLVAWWIATKVDPFVVTSAPTSHQVKSILWREIRRAKNNIELPGNISKGQVPEWKIADELVGFGRKPADYIDPNEAAAAFQGIHALHTLVVLDEGSGIPDWLATACETLITNENSRMLIIGNPDNPVSYFARAFKPNSGFHQISISAFDTPAFTGEPISENLAARLISKLWVDERAKRWTENSPLYKSKVLAEFPDITDDTVFTPAILERAIQADRSRTAIQTRGRYGMDIARLGSDETVVYQNRNGYVRLSDKWSKLDTMATVGRYRRLNHNDEPDTAITGILDATGLGAGVYDRLRELHYPVVPFNGGEQAYNPLKYKNRRAEAYWEAAKLMEEGVIDIDPDDLDLQAELMEVHFKLTSTGQIQLEAKEDIAARLGHSPDRADAFVMALQRAASLQEMEHQTNQTNQTNQQQPQAPQPEPVRQTVKSAAPTRSDAEQEPEDLVSDIMEVKF